MLRYHTSCEWITRTCSTLLCMKLLHCSSSILLQQLLQICRHKLDLPWQMWPEWQVECETSVDELNCRTDVLTVNDQVTDPMPSQTIAAISSAELRQVIQVMWYCTKASFVMLQPTALLEDARSTASSTEVGRPWLD